MADASPSSAPPLILTLRMDAPSFERLDGLRRLYFPPALNVVPAHITLFHHLPGDQADAIAATLEAACRQERPMQLTAAGLRFLGRGVAYTLESAALTALRGRLAARWQPWLTAQDRQPYRPHLTIQNKVPAGEARALHARLAADFVPFRVEGEGLSLWRYLRGPWALVGSFPFREACDGRTAAPAAG